MTNGYFGIGIYHPKTKTNYGTLFRSARSLGASFIFMIGKRYKAQCSDTTKTHRHIPAFDFDSFELFYQNMPYDCRLLGIELDERAIPIQDYKHPQRAIYLLGAEDHGLPPEVINKCVEVIQLPGTSCLNVSVAGSIVMYDRLNKNE